MSHMESLDKLQAELSGNVYADAFHTLYKLSQDVSAEHSELMAQAMKWVRKEKVEPLEAENAKLRELASLVSEYISHDRCEGCVIKTACNSYELDECWMTTKLRNQLRELGVEVDE